jgi:leucine dehydrogenase
MVQGVGHVGQYLVSHLINDGAIVSITDINEARIKETMDQHKVTFVKPEDMLNADMDIYAPCALGATLNDESLQKLKAPVVAGAANNQLADEVKHGQMLIEKGIVYAPDFLINAGGLINVAGEASGTYNVEKVNNDVEKIYQRVLDIFSMAEEKNITTQAAAIHMAQARINAVAQLRTRR